MQEQLVVQWWAVRDDRLLASVVRDLLDDPDPVLEPLVHARLQELLADLPLILGEQQSSARLARAIVGNLAAAQRTPADVAHAQHLRTQNMISALAGRLAPTDAVGSERSRDARRRVSFAVPLQAVSFTGRQDELGQLDRALMGGEVAVVAQAITGLGGIGKNQLAARYVHQHGAQYERIVGDEHPATLTARANLAVSYGSAGRTADAIELGERVLADSERILGDEHPNTRMFRANLAVMTDRAPHSAPRPEP